MDFTVDINGKGQLPIKCCLVLFVFFNILINCEDTDQTQHSVASDLGLHCLCLSRKMMQYFYRLIPLAVTKKKAFSCGRYYTCIYKEVPTLYQLIGHC